MIDDRSLVDASISHKLGTMPAWTPAISTVVCTSNIQQFGLLGADVTQLLVKFYRRASQPIELPPGVNLQVLPPELVQTVYGALIRGIEEMIETGEQTRRANPYPTRSDPAQRRLKRGAPCRGALRSLERSAPPTPRFVILQLAIPDAIGLRHCRPHANPTGCEPRRPRMAH